MEKGPGSRYHVLDAWNPAELKDMALGPCPFWHQFTVYDDQLDLHMVQRSCDTYLGVPFNIAQDALLAHMVAKETGLNPRKFFHSMINTHIYLGVSPRADFWKDEGNVENFQGTFKEIEARGDYLELKKWYLETAPLESEGNEGKDHVPFVLEQLSKEPKELPFIKLEDVHLMEAIKLPVGDVVEVEGYSPHKWDAKAEMSA
jgi:thymidylate synthase